MGVRAGTAQGWTLSEGSMLHGLALPKGEVSRGKELVDRQAETVLEGLSVPEPSSPYMAGGQKRCSWGLTRNSKTSSSLWRDVLASGGLCCPPLRGAQLAAHVVQSCC